MNWMDIALAVMSFIGVFALREIWSIKTRDIPELKLELAEIKQDLKYLVKYHDDVNK
jgi:hypothetical protein